MNLNKTISLAEQHFADDKLSEAATLCKEMLDAKNDYAPAYYLMAEIKKKLNSLDGSLKFTDLALRFEPNNASYWLQHGHTLFLMGKFDLARNSLIRAQELDSKSSQIAMMLASTYAREFNFKKAKEFFALAIALDANNVSIREQYGVMLQMHKEYAAAEEQYNEIVRLKNNYWPVYVHLGKLMMEQGKLDLAESHFSRALSLDAKAHEAMLFLSRIRESQNDLEEAVRLSTQAAYARPDFPRCYLQLASQLMKQNKPLDAERIYSKGLEVLKGNAELEKALAILLIQLNRREDAKPYVERVLAREPDNEALRYFKSVYEGTKLESAPREYVRSLFDDYANRFDKDLVEKLQYKTPEALSEEIRKTLSQKGNNSTGLSLLDLGCGTGLAAEALKDITQSRIGVDLSSRMIGIAKEKGLYSAFQVEDMQEYLQKCLQQFDLVVAADAFVYLGGLENVFDGVKKVLRPQGIFAFSVESGDDVLMYTTRTSGRFAHSKAYIETLAAKTGFTIASMKALTLRMEGNNPIDGYVAVLHL